MLLCPNVQQKRGRGGDRGRTVNSCTFYENEICKEVVVTLLTAGTRCVRLQGFELKTL